MKKEKRLVEIADDSEPEVSEEPKVILSSAAPEIPRPVKPEVLAVYDIGAALAAKIEPGIPVFADRKEDREIPSWIDFPPFSVTVESAVDEERDYLFSVAAYSDGHQNLLSLLDHLIRIAKDDIEVSGVRIWLHAVHHALTRVIGRQLYKLELRYYFRMKKIPEQITEEAK